MTQAVIGFGDSGTMDPGPDDGDPPDEDVDKESLLSLRREDYQFALSSA